MMTLTTASTSSLCEVNVRLDRIVTTSGLEFTLYQPAVLMDLSEAVLGLLRSSKLASPEDVALARDLIAHERCARRIEAAAEDCGCTSGVPRFLRELKAIVLGERVVSLALQSPDDRTDLYASILHMVAALQGDEEDEEEAQTEARSMPHLPDDLAHIPGNDSCEIVARCFEAIARHPHYSQTSEATQQARAWIDRRLAALSGSKPRTPGTTCDLRVPVVRGSSTGGQIGWLHLCSRSAAGQRGCVPEPRMLCYLRDEAFDRAIRTAWDAAQAFVQEEANRDRFFPSLSMQQILERLSNEQVSWSIEIGGQRDYLRGDSLGAAATVAFVSLLANLPYNSQILITATTDATGKFGSVGQVAAKVQSASMHQMGKVLVSPVDWEFGNSGLLDRIEKVENIGDALKWTTSIPSSPPPAEPDLWVGNLLQSLTSFVGREQESEEIQEILTGSRLLTLTGMGGAGKTRLAVEVGWRSKDRYRDGVWMVELAGLSEAKRLYASVAEALEIKEEAGKPILKTLISALKGRRLLLILDNCEHLIEPCAHLVKQLLGNCPDLTILATSREPLRIFGERTYPVACLSLPAREEAVTLENLHHYSGIQLFVERARLNRSSFTVTEESLSALVEICRHLDGIPLAIELAAAYIRSLTLQDLSRRLDDRFALLKDGDRTLPKHQQTLSTLLDWSYDLLTSRQQRLFARLSVFADGWTYDMAHSICSDRAVGGVDGIDEAERIERSEGIGANEVRDLMTDLCDKSLILANTEGDTTRYRMLETLREYAQARLESFGERTTLQTRHRDQFQRLVVELEPQLTGPEQNSCLARMAAELNNLRGALTCYEAAANSLMLESDEAKKWLQMLCVLWRYWYIRGPISEGIEWLEKAIRANKALPTTDNPFLARANNIAGIMTKLTGDFSAARTYHMAAIPIAQQQNQSLTVAASLNNLALLDSAEGNHERAYDLFAQSLRIFRDSNCEYEAASALANLGMAQINLQRFEIANEHLQAALTIFRQLTYTADIASVLENLAGLSLLRCDLEQARIYVKESIELRKGQENWSGIAFCVQYVTLIALRQGEFERGTYFLGVADAHLKTSKRIHSVLKSFQFQQDVDRAIDQLGAARFQQILQNGSTRYLKEVIEEVITYLNQP